MMRPLLAASMLALVMAPPSAFAQTKADLQNRKTPTAAEQAPLAPLRAACNLCFTCGASWPVFSGQLGVATTGATERGAACSGVLTPSTDPNPFLCCRRVQ
jgi:hypothetical protein